MHIESPKVSVKKSSQELFDFLLDVKNFEKLMPENISKFEVLEQGKFLFALKGMPEIILKVKQTTPTSQIVLGAASDKLPFTLTADIQQTSENTSEVSLCFSGEFNPMMAMMVKKPITSLVNTLTSNMQEV